MRKWKAFTAACAVSLTAMASVPQVYQQAGAADQIHIMPIGDSITFGLGEDGGYRKYLDYALKAKEIDFDMVGPEGRNSESFNYNGQNCRYDGNHAGYSGFTIKQQYPIPSWGENGLLERLQSKDAVKNAQPDIVLLIIGTNDMTANRDLTACENDLHTLIDYILGDMPEDGVIFLGSIPEFTAYGGSPQRVGNYNNTVKKVAESYGDNVMFADVHGSLNGMADMSSDNLHPSGAGYEKMGKFWAEVIAEYLTSKGGDADNENPEILHSDFEKSLSGWQSRGGASVAVTTEKSFEGTGAASVTGRTMDWNGIAYELNSRRCPVGTHLQIKAKIMQNTESSAHFKMTMQYNDGEKTVYDTFAECDSAQGVWATLSSMDYVIPEGTEHILYFETSESTCDFYLDEVMITKLDENNLPAAGDLNGDGAFNLADAVLLQKWLLSLPDTELQNWKAGDLHEDDVLNVYDLNQMKRILFQS
ncbi:MAG: GDSL-type esterase/lipase family protein [Oscillospiraceae bacterium]|nr:GDSL-type esterase/lipase family protein [Oscillospiraceae bacterium]